MSTKPNLSVSIQGAPKTGKTHLMCSFPEPLCVFSFDIRLEQVLPKFKDKSIDVKEYPIPVHMTAKPKPYAKPIWDAFLEDYIVAVESGQYTTLGIDTGTALYEIARTARAEEMGRSIMPYEYAEVYARITGLILKARLAGVNLVMTHWLKDEYIGDKSTGRQVFDGCRRVNDYIDVIVELHLERRAKDTKVITTIMDNAYEPSLNGITLENTTYDELLALLVGG